MNSVTLFYQTEEAAWDRYRAACPVRETVTQPIYSKLFECWTVCVRTWSLD